MKHLSFFLLNNSLGSKMRKGFRNICNGDTSTSTLDQTKPHPSYNVNLNYMHTPDHTPTLEDMILQLELEEEMARKANKLHDFNSAAMRGRMSCVNSSDILRSARNALNQYPRFSLDGKDAMYRSSFRNSNHSICRKSVCCDHGLAERMSKAAGHFDPKLEPLPPTLAGESVIWCKPGVVAKLMGLEAMPVPANKQTLSSIIKRQNIKRRAERQELERRLSVDVNKFTCNGLGKGRVASCSKNSGYCVMKPVTVQPTPNDHRGGWPTRRFR